MASIPAATQTEGTPIPATPERLRSPHARVASQTLVYVVAAIATKISGLILAPLYLNPELLSQANYGQFVVLESTWSLAIVLLGFGLPSAIPRFTLRHEGASESGAGWTAFVIAAAASGATVAVGVLLFAYGEALSLSPFVGRYSIPFAVYVALRISAAIPLAVLRTHERALRFSIAGIAEAVVMVVVAYFGLVVIHAELDGLVYAHVGGAAAGFAASVLLVYPYMRVRFRPEIVWPLLKFGSGILASSLCLLLVSVSDRYVVTWMVGLKSVAVYGWASRLAGTVRTILVMAFQRTFHVVSLQIGQDDAGEKAAFIRRMFRMYVVAAGALVAVLSLGAFDLTRMLSKNLEYARSDHLLLFICLGNMAYGIFYITADELLTEGRTWRLANLVLWAVLLNAIAGVVLVSLLGPLGAAIATFLSFSALAVLAACYSKTARGIRYPWYSYVATSVIVMALFLVALPTREWSTPARLVARASLLVGYPLSLIAFRVVALHELCRISSAGLSFVQRSLSAFKGKGVAR